jgi:Tripartite ATP-independent periplasmic transporter, DctM component
VGPVADKLGIDLIWFGVLLGVNMQTSFMHPPFGFALFYLRSVAPTKDYLDKLTGKLTTRVTTGQIYWGAVPFVIIQLIMVSLVIIFPQMVMVYKSSESTVDPSKVEFNIQQEGDAPVANPYGEPPAAPTEGQKQEKADDAAQSLQDAFKVPPAPDAAKK